MLSEQEFMSFLSENFKDRYIKLGFFIFELVIVDVVKNCFFAS